MGNSRTGMRVFLRTVFLACLALVGVALNSCVDRDNAPTGPGQQTWTISGKSYFAGSKDPLPGVLVKCGGLSSTSGADGGFEIRGVPRGPRVLTAEKAGCDAYSSTLEVNSDLTHFVYLTFKKTNLSGYVMNAFDGPVKGAKVVLGALFDYTDISGRYDFIGASRGADTLFVLHPSYLDFKTAISLSSPETTFDVTLKRDSVFQSQLNAFSYVDQTFPSQYFPTFPNYQTLYLRANGYDSAGVYHDKIERNVFVQFNFPSFLADERVSLLEANFQMCIDGPHVPFDIKTYAIISVWSYTVTYNTQPRLGQLLFSGTIGDSSSAKYWTVLGTDGVRTMIADFRARGETYGIEIKGGTIDAIGFYSSRAAQNQPKMILKVRL